jgi:predicted component of type VI protein secretion system
MSATYQLVIRSGVGAGKVLPLEKSEMHVGRDVTNDLVISDEKVSRRHARLYSEGDQYVVEDLGSTNGTFINGARLSGPHLLRVGEQITFGETSIVSYERINNDPNATVMSTISAAPASPATKHPSPPPIAAPSARKKAHEPAAPSDVPLAREEFEAAPVAAGPKKKSRTLLFVVLIIVALFICLCGVVFWMIDSNNLYCTIAPSIFPGCPAP